MKRAFLTIALAVQMVALPAFAQTNAATTGTTGGDATSGTYGSDWSTTLGLALFSDGGTTVHSELEVASQWKTLSDDDKDIVRRDCMMHGQQSGGMTGSTGITTTGAGTTDTGRAGGTAGSAGETAGSPAGSTAGTAGGSSATGSTPAINVTMEQMETICAAIDDP